MLEETLLGKEFKTFGGGTPQDFCLTFTDELERQLFMKKTVEVGQ